MLPSPAAQNVLIVLVDASVVAAIAAGAFVHRPSRSLPWHLFASGAAMTLVGNVVWAIYEGFLQAVPYPSVADALYFANASLFVGALLLVGRGGIGRTGANLIDLLIVGGSAVLFLLVAARLASMIGGRKILEERLAFRAFHDPLTRLSNRELFVDRFERALARSERQGGRRRCCSWTSTTSSS